MFTFIAEEQANPACEWPVTEMCRVLEVSRSGFYDWQIDVPSVRELQDRVLAREIELIYVASNETYGVPRMTHWLRQQGFAVNHKRVGRIMAELGLEGESGRRRVKTTIVDKGATAAEDHVRRDFNPPAPDIVWCGDITYLHTGEGWLYLATVIDLYLRRVLGWAAADHMRTELVADALTMAVAARGGHVAGVGSCRAPQRPWVGLHLGRALRLLRRRAVDGSDRCVPVGDNSVAESWFGTMKRELANRRRWTTRAEARRDLIRWIEGWFTPAGCTHRTTTAGPSTGKPCTTVAVTAPPHSNPVRQTGRTSLDRGVDIAAHLLAIHLAQPGNRPQPLTPQPQPQHFSNLEHWNLAECHRRLSVCQPERRYSSMTAPNWRTPTRSYH